MDLLLGIVFLAIGTYAAGLSQNLWQLTLGYGVLTGIAATGASGGAWSILVSNWFPIEQRGKILGLIMTGMRVSPMIFEPLGAALIGKVSWNGTLIIFAFAVLAVFPLCWFFMKEAPSAKGTSPSSPVPPPKREGLLLIKRCLEE